MFLFLMWARNNHLRYVFHYVPKLREHNEESVVSFGFWAVVLKTGKIAKNLPPSVPFGGSVP